MKRREFIKGSAIVGATIATPGLLAAGSGIIDSAHARRVHRILNMQREKVGTLPILRAFAGDQTDYVSPYVLFDEFGPVELAPGSSPLRVDAHPHAGVTPTTYFLSGSGHHKDSLDFDFQVHKGDFMMFSSGRGAIHMEETGRQLYDEGGTYHGFQIWLNTPARYKFEAPATQVYKDGAMGTIVHEKYTARVVLGELDGARSNIELLSPAFYFHIRMNPGCRLTIPTDPTHNAFVYAISGSLELEGRKELGANQLALYRRGESDISLFSAGEAEILLLGGRPLDEPVYSWGPFVMNTEEQIRLCLADYRAGKMGDPEVVNR